MSYQDEFLEIYRSKISREGSVPLLEWLQKTDFFTAPASSKYHCACRGGLVQHSVSVYHTMMEKHFEQGRTARKASPSAPFCTMSARLSSIRKGFAM